jgi:hypothetical protein
MSDWDLLLAYVSSVTTLAFIAVLTWVAISDYRHTRAVSSACLSLGSLIYLTATVLLWGVSGFPSVLDRFGLSVQLPSEIMLGLSYASWWAYLAAYSFCFVGGIALTGRLVRRRAVDR